MKKPGIPKGYKMFRPISVLADLMRETDHKVLLHCRRLNINTVRNKRNEIGIRARDYVRIKSAILRERYYQDRKERGLPCPKSINKWAIRVRGKK